ncbi:hypothetical protein N7536_002532 [Penicillium majusculum]|nr:hypothetical protein N7536_002532 [Penicillium majusculum]
MTKSENVLVRTCSEKSLFERGRLCKNVTGPASLTWKGGVLGCWLGYVVGKSFEKVGIPSVESRIEFGGSPGKFGFTWDGGDKL